MFRRYMHVERATDPLPQRINGLLHGEVAVFPKLDGANHCAWHDPIEDTFMCASRRVVLAEDDDQTGFYAYCSAHPEIARMCEENRDLRFYGEYLTPHTLKAYRDDAWGRWYVFDVWSASEHAYLPFDVYEPLVRAYGIEVVPPLAVENSPSRDRLMELLGSNDYLMRDGAVGEGIIIKNYGFRDTWGEQTWGKIVTDDFRQAFGEAWGVEDKMTIEEKGARDLMPEGFVSKELRKFTDDRGVEWDDKMFPNLLEYIMGEWKEDYHAEIIDWLMSMPPKDPRKFQKALNKRLVSIVKGLARRHRSSVFVSSSSLSEDSRMSFSGTRSFMTSSRMFEPPDSRYFSYMVRYILSMAALTTDCAVRRSPLMTEKAQMISSRLTFSSVSSIVWRTISSAVRPDTDWEQHIKRWLDPAADLTMYVPITFSETIYPITSIHPSKTLRILQHFFPRNNHRGHHSSSEYRTGTIYKLAW